MSECDHENNQSTHIFMNHTKTQKLLPIKILEAAYWYFVLLILLLLRRKKIKQNKDSHGPKTPLVAWFLLCFNMYLFSAQFEQVYVFLAYALLLYKLA